MSRCTKMVDVGRRQFLRGGSIAAAGLATAAVLPAEQAKAAPANAQIDYPSNKLANFADLKVNEPIDIAYPDADSPGDLDQARPSPWTGGVGPDGDIVAYSVMCPHKGWHLSYNADDKTLQLPRSLHPFRLRGWRTADLGPCHAEPATVHAPRGRERRHLCRRRGRTDLRSPVQRAGVGRETMTYKRQIDRLPILPQAPPSHNVTCHYCIVGCGYKAYTWPIAIPKDTPGSNAWRAI